MGRYRIAVLPGDGIGPEVTEVAVRVMQEAAVANGVSLDLAKYSAGAEHYRLTGVVMPDAVLQDCLRADAVLLGAIGLPDVRKPDGTEVNSEMMQGLRWALELYAAVRPVRLFPGVPGVLRRPGPIDFVIVRENTEGLFASFGGGISLKDQVATDTMVITREGTERVAEFAFRLAERRPGRPQDGRRMVTCVDKANVFRSFAFFRKVFFEVAGRHPEITAEATYVDAMSLFMVQNPAAIDVVVTENQFGDILSDLGAGIVGGLGLAPSGEIGERHGLFQPSHGTAPTIAGQDVANPIATILSAAMLLDWIGERKGDPNAVEAGRQIEAAVMRMLADGQTLTRDLGGTAGTRAVGDAVVRALEQVAGEERK